MHIVFLFFFYFFWGGGGILNLESTYPSRIINIGADRCARYILLFRDLSKRQTGHGRTN